MTILIETFYAILALVAFGLVAIAVVLHVVALVSDTAADWWDQLADFVAPNALAMAWIVAFLATAGSLYFSEIAAFEPCVLCWYQRIAMYPNVVILAIAVAYRDARGAIYAAALAGIGAIISAYHVALEWFPQLDSGACDPDNPCTLIWFRVFGFVSLPTLALAAFLLILTLAVIRARRIP
jgi:disulfide bond formation protein DsbB